MPYGLPPNWCLTGERPEILQKRLGWLGHCVLNLAIVWCEELEHQASGKLPEKGRIMCDTMMLCNVVRLGFQSSNPVSKSTKTSAGHVHLADQSQMPSVDLKALKQTYVQLLDTKIHGSNTGWNRIQQAGTGRLLPTRECYGQALLRQERYSEAEQVFRTALEGDSFHAEPKPSYRELIPFNLLDFLVGDGDEKWMCLGPILKPLFFRCLYFLASHGTCIDENGKGWGGLMAEIYVLCREATSFFKTVRSDRWLNLQIVVARSVSWCLMIWL